MEFMLELLVGEILAYSHNTLVAGDGFEPPTFGL